MTKLHRIDKVKRVTVKLVKPLPGTTEVDLQKEYKLILEEDGINIPMGYGEHRDCFFFEIEKLLKEGWLEVLKEEEDFRIFVDDTLVEFENDHIEIGCHTIKNTHMIQIAAAAAAKAAGQNYQFVPDDDTEFDSEIEIPESKEIIKLKVTKAMPGLKVGTPLTLRNGEVEHTSPTYGYKSFYEREIRLLIKNGWLEELEKVETPPVVPIMTIGGEPVNIIKNHVDADDCRVPNDIVFAIVAEIARRQKEKEQTK